MAAQYSSKHGVVGRAPAELFMAFTDLRNFKQMVPQAKVLFIGPADMGRRTSPTLSHPMMGAVSKALKQMCLKEGVAYWDMFAAMGGEGAMSRWAQEKPSLASPDLIHFSHQGAEKIATMFTESLMLYYDYYDARK